MFLRVYKALNILITPLVILLLWYRISKHKEDPKRAKEKWGRPTKTRPKNKLLWIHAASVGEMVSTGPIIEVMQKHKGFSVLLTSGTVTSADLFESQYQNSKVIHQYVPLENYFAIRRFLKYWKPDLAIFVESEFWPCILDETSKVTKIISLNTRLSDRSFKRWKKCNLLFSNIAAMFSVFLPQSMNDYKRLKDLGVRNLYYAGNMKYMVPSLSANKHDLSLFKEMLTNKKVVLFISTHPGEEDLIVKIYESLRAKIKDLFFIIAPRHPIRSTQVLGLISDRGYSVVAKSKVIDTLSGTQFMIADSIGQMGTLIPLAHISVVCGSFVNIGGHNPIESAKLKSAIVIGPYISKQKEICDEFRNNNAAIFVKNYRECSQAIYALFSNETTYKRYVTNASELIKTKRDILGKVIGVLEKYLKS
jgi:3-deoxy-D-manno-octulosonic-acid transferase